MKLELIENQTFDEERALYHLKNTEVKNCIFAGMADIFHGNTKVAAAVDEALTINSGE